jgi:hypothetical protein
MSDARATIERVWHSDAAGMLGVLARRLGDLDRAEEALQDALAEALSRWPTEGVPDNPPGHPATRPPPPPRRRCHRPPDGRTHPPLL